MNDLTTQAHRSFFRVAAAFNFLAGGALLVYRPWFDWLGVTPNPENGLWIILFAGLVLMLGYGYYLASVDFTRHRPIIQLGTIGKLWVFGVALAGFLTGAASWHLPVIASADLVFAVMFIRILLARPGGD